MDTWSRRKNKHKTWRKRDQSLKTEPEIKEDGSNPFSGQRIENVYFYASYAQGCKGRYKHEKEGKGRSEKGPNGILRVENHPM